MNTGRLAQISWWPALWVASALLAGCFGGGTVVVSFVVDPVVAIRDADGKAAEAGVVVTVPGRPAADSVQFRGRDFDWIITAGADGLGGFIANRSQDTLCMRFDQAQIRSNFHPEPIPLRTYVWAVYRGKWSLLGSTDPRQRQYFGPPSFCLEPGKEAQLSFAPDVRPLFPTQKIFNVQWPDNEPQLTDRGTGNWLALTLPLEVGERRQTLDVKLTPVESHAKISYH